MDLGGSGAAVLAMVVVEEEGSGVTGILLLLLPFAIVVDVPFGVDVPPLCFCTSSRHFLTISLASRAISGVFDCLNRLTATPILVDRSKSSVGTTPVFSSLSKFMIFAEGSPAVVIFVSAFAFSFTSLVSMMTFAVCYLGSGWWALECFGCNVGFQVVEEIASTVRGIQSISDVYAVSLK